MKTRFHLVSALLLLVTVVAAPASAQTSVWKVTSGDRTMYLGGTFHLLRPSDFPLPAEYQRALEASSTLCFEVDIAQMQSPKALGLIMKEASLPEGQTLQSTLSPAAWAAVEAHCAEAGIPVEQVNRLKPWMFMMQVAMMELMKLGVTNEGVDMRMHREGVAAGKSFAALETLEEQIKFLTHSADGFESEYLISSLQDLERIPQMFDEMVQAWRTGDLKALDDLLAREMREAYPKMYESLMVERNRNWMPQLEAMLASEPVEFVLVGAGHLCGEDGLIAMLREKGATIEQVGAQ